MVQIRLNSRLKSLRATDDTAQLSRGKRVYAEEGQGIIQSWDDYEAFPWDKIKVNLDDYYEFLNKNLPDGMKVMVGGIFHADDLGYKSATMINPESLRKEIFPWFKKYADLAHSYNKMCWYHCCGNIYSVIEDIIEDIGFDAFHSFQDTIMPVIEFKQKYGHRIAALGGLDMDKLCRFDEQKVRTHTRDILDKCVPGGRYALGSGNTIANYMPVENYLAMLEEGAQ